MKNRFHALWLAVLVSALLPIATFGQDHGNTAIEPAPAATDTSATPPARTSAPAAADPATATAPAAATPTGSTTPMAAAASPAPAPVAPAPAAPPARDTTATPPDDAPAAGATTAASTASTSTTLHTLAAPDSEDAVAPVKGHGRGRRAMRATSSDRVAFASDAHLAKDEIADAVVAIGGNAISEGTTDAVTAVGGDAHVTGPVQDAVVAVGGDAYVDARVDSVVAVLGDIHLGPHAEVMHDVVSVGGTVQRDPNAIVHGDMPIIGMGRHHLPVPALQTYVATCLLKGRPLAFAPHLGWAWSIALGFFAFYLFLALLFGRTVDANCRTLEQYPGGSVLAAVLTVLLTPVVIVLLCITVVGIAVVPFVLIGLVAASLFGKVVMLAWIGRRLLAWAPNAKMHPVVAVFLGGIVALALYTVPYGGLFIYKLLDLLGLGVVVYSVILSSKREKAVRAAASAPAATAAATPAFTVPASAQPLEVDPAAAASGPAVATAVPPLGLSLLPRAGFWIRLGALLIDFILVAFICMMSHVVLPRFLHLGPAGVLLVLAIYGAVMWQAKGSTIGGIVCGLRVVRLDGREIDWATACVRALGCFLSLIVVFLGFIWIAFDDEKQSWHDKIAGTTVVHAGRTVSLV